MPSSRPPRHASGTSLAALATGASNPPSPSVVYEGWVLKKRRKKMQGFARRYFTLYQSGLLSYSFEPGQPTRDQVSLHQAAISTAPGRKDIHIDSNIATFHIKCLSTEDFNLWMTAFRKFIAPGHDARRSASVRLAQRHGSLNLNRSGVVVDEMGSTIAELEDAILAMKQDTSPKKNLSLNKSKFEKEKHKEHHKESNSMFGLFKRSSHSAMHEFGVGNNHIDTNDLSDHLQPSPQQRVQVALDTLKAQHAMLIKSMHILSHFDTAQSAHGSPLPFTAEEEEDSQPSSQPSTPLTRLSKRTSTATTLSDSPSEWFDASEGAGDGAEEFILDVQASPDGTEQPTRILPNDSRSSLGQASNSSVDTDIEDGQEVPPRLPSEVSESDPDHGALHVVRRTQLPAPPVGDEGSLFAVLKKNVGKDLSTIALPVTFNEPLTLLQRAAEEVEYYDILTQAAGATDSIERLSYVAAFAISSYAHTRHRSGRKGFNPMLAETFEDIRMKFIAEKVRHQPLVMAYHAEGPGWELYATSAGKTQFWGKSLEIIPLGTTHLKIGDDHFEWKKPSSFLRNMMVGTKYLEHCGKTTIENTTTHARCVLEFKQSGYWGATNLVSGIVYAPSGEVVTHLEGKWDDQISQTLDSEHFRILWRVTPFPKNTHGYYGFTSFGITLNEITSDIEGKLPPTDSRYRPDVRALEEGDLDLAEEQKLKVEEIQRERRKRGVDRQPRWFKQVGEEWLYVGGYWEARAKNWKGMEIDPLWTTIHTMAPD